MRAEERYKGPKSVQ